MADWKLAPCLQVLFNEFDRIAPSRDHASDGSIGDAAHQAESSSDHNPDKNGIVCAIDVDDDLRASGFTMEQVIQYLVAECKKSNDVGKDRGRLNYFIYNRRIWRADGGWRQETYTGSSPHTEHAHFSCEHDSSYVNDKSPWGLIERFDSVSEQDVTNALTKFFAVSQQPAEKGGLPESKIGHDASSQGVPNPFGGYARQYEVIGQIGAELLAVKADLANVADAVANLTHLVESHIAGLIEGENPGGVHAS